MLRVGRFPVGLTDYKELSIIEPIPEKPKSKIRQAYEIGTVSSVGIEFAVAIVIGWAVGHYLDGKLGTDPYLMLLFLAFGIAAGFMALVRIARETRDTPEDAGQD